MNNLGARDQSNPKYVKCNKVMHVFRVAYKCRQPSTCIRNGMSDAVHDPMCEYGNCAMGRVLGVILMFRS